MSLSDNNPIQEMFTWTRLSLGQKTKVKQEGTITLSKRKLSPLNDLLEMEKSIIAVLQFIFILKLR